MGIFFVLAYEPPPVLSDLEYLSAVHILVYRHSRTCSVGGYLGEGLAMKGMSGGACSARQTWKYESMRNAGVRRLSVSHSVGVLAMKGKSKAARSGRNKVGIRSSRTTLQGGSTTRGSST